MVIDRRELAKSMADRASTTTGEQARRCRSIGTRSMWTTNKLHEHRRTSSPREGVRETSSSFWGKSSSPAQQLPWAKFPRALVLQLAAMVRRMHMLSLRSGKTHIGVICRCVRTETWRCGLVLAVGRLVLLQCCTSLLVWAAVEFFRRRAASAVTTSWPWNTKGNFLGAVVIFSVTRHIAGRGGRVREGTFASQGRRSAGVAGWCGRAGRARTIVRRSPAERWRSERSVSPGHVPSLSRSQNIFRDVGVSCERGAPGLLRGASGGVHQRALGWSWREAEEGAWRQPGCGVADVGAFTGTSRLSGLQGRARRLAVDEN